MVTITRLNDAEAGFDACLERLLSWDEAANEEVAATVAKIIADVRSRGDAALVDYSNRLDRRTLSVAGELEVGKSELQSALQGIDAKSRTALETAAERIRYYHQHQLQSSWSYTEGDGTRLGQQITPLERVGIYVPGGKASYPSSVLMNAIPARVAGVDEIIMVAPAPGGGINPLVLAAAAIAGVDRVFTLGGAQAIAALAYGTATVPKVDKIVGPGNVYVAAAKRAVFGQVGLDMVAGPSEILIVCDGQSPADWVAMDLFSQAEHDADAQALLVSPDGSFLDQVAASIERLLPEMERGDMIAASLSRRGALIQVADMDRAVALVNRIAPEHLELSVVDPDALLPSIRHAGAIFMGPYTAEAVGDYCAGPNHVLPTSATARFSSPLGVYDFQKRSSVIYCSRQGAKTLGRIASTLARGESLVAHARSAEFRCED